MKFALFGCGRIGRMHADNIAANPRASLFSVYDVVSDAAAEVAASHHCKVAGSVDEILSDDAIEAVLIASPTCTHADLLEASAKAGKPVFCEKPIDLSLERVDQCAAAIAACGVPIQIGFNRRFDPGHRAARQALEAGEIGDLHQVIITSRDPAIPPRAYLESAGGLFRDMTIHDFDLARFMLGEEPEEVFAIAGPLGDPELGAALDENDTAMIVMRTASGKMCHINNSRSAAYGYDQRVELLGNSGMLISDNRKPHEMRQYTATQTETAQPYLYFFIERYHEAFVAELEAFMDAVEQGVPCQVQFEDGRRALMLAEAAYQSLQSGAMVKVGAAR